MAVFRILEVIDSLGVGFSLNTRYFFVSLFGFGENFLPLPYSDRWCPLERNLPILCLIELVYYLDKDKATGEPN